jgi:hypothetical protein
MSIGINLNNWKVRDFWAAVGAGIAGVTGLVTGGNYIRRAPIRARAEKMDARRVQQELQDYHTKGTYNDADLARAYAEQKINPKDYVSDPSNYVGQPIEDRLARVNVAKKKTTKKPASMNKKSKMGSISLSNNFDNTINSFDNPNLYNYSSRVSWTDGLNSSTKRLSEQYAIAEVGDSNPQNSTLMENLAKPRNATVICVVTFFASAGLYLFGIKKLRQTKWFTKNFELDQWNMDKIEQLEQKIDKLQQEQKEISTTQVKILELLKKANI